MAQDEQDVMGQMYDALHFSKNVCIEASDIPISSFVLNVSRVRAKSGPILPHVEHTAVG